MTSNTRTRTGAVLGALLLALWLAMPGAALADRPHEAAAREIARSLACPVCQGLSVADSPSQLATQMRGLILERLEAGDSREQIVQYFVDRYGEGILLEPPKRGFALLVWWVPVLGVLAGAAAVGLGLARWVRPRDDGVAAGEPLSPAALAVYLPRLEAELASREGLAESGGRP